MSKNTTTFKSFRDLAVHVHAKDIEAATRLKKTQHLRKPGTLAVAKQK
jgi:hypothetical protein